MSCFNYADDISILCKHRDYDSAYNDLLSEASTMIHWYKMNYMQASLEKIQFIYFRQRTTANDFTIES